MEFKLIDIKSLPWKSYFQHFKNYWLAFLIFLGGLVLSLIAFYFYEKQELQRTQAEFNRLADIRIFFIQDEITGTIEQLNYVKQFFYASQKVTKRDFRIFTRNSLNLYRNLMCLGWHSINHQDIPRKEEEQPLLNFISLGLDLTTGQYHFFPLEFLELSNQHKPFYIDSRFYSQFKSLLQYAGSSTTPVLSNDVDFFQDGQKKGFFIFDSVYLERAINKTNARKSLRGVVIGFANFETIMQRARSVLEPIGFNIAIYNRTEKGEKLLYWSPSSIPQKADKGYKDIVTEKLEKWSRIYPFHVGNRIWTIKITPTMTFINNHKGWSHWEVPIIGIILSALTSTYFLFLVNRRLLIEKEVSTRTEELAATNQLLQQEIHERQKIEEATAVKQHNLQKRHEALEYLTKFTTSALQSAVNEVIMRTALVMQIDRVSIWFYEKNDVDRLTCAGLYCLTTNTFSNHLEFISSYFPHYFNALKMHTHLIMPSPYDPELNQELASYMANFQIISKLDIPIIFEDNLLGVLCCEETRGHREWLLEDRHFGQNIADIIAIMIEQSARRKAEKALQESEERIRFITQKAIDGIISVDDKGEIISWNYGAEHMFGYSESEILGKPLTLLLPLQEVNQDMVGLKPIELKGRNKHGKVFPVEVSHTRWRSGSLYYDTIITRDITERKDYEKKLIKAMKEAKAASDAKSEFLTTISHELRTPLNVMIGFTQILLMEMDGPINAPQKISLEKIEKSSFHLLSLINDILDLAKIEANKMELEIQQANIADIISASIEEVTPLARQKGLKLSWSIEKPAIYLEIDKMRIKQVIINLLSNAVKFTEEGAIQIKVFNHPNSVEIQVIDTGIGLTKEEIDKLFKSFTQADSSITRKFGGTGLGLAISKKIVDLHRGSITVKSEKNKGSTFIVMLPKVQG